MPLSTALIATSSARVAEAITRASVVFPVPGGPQRMREGTWSVSIASRSSVLGPRMWRCPTTSSSVRGRILSARGTTRGSRAAERNRSPGWPRPERPRGMYVGGIPDIVTWRDAPEITAQSPSRLTVKWRRPAR